MTHTLTVATNALLEAKADLAILLEGTEKSAALLRNIIDRNTDILANSEAGLDVDKILHAEHVVFASDYSKAGTDGKSCVDDAIKQLATGYAQSGGADLFERYFGTKNYDRWTGQRSDHPYWAGPSHGHVVFKIGLTKEVRGRTGCWGDLTADEIEAAIYYLSNIERIQSEKTAA